MRHRRATQAKPASRTLGFAIIVVAAAGIACAIWGAMFRPSGLQEAQQEFDDLREVRTAGGLFTPDHFLLPLSATAMKENVTRRSHNRDAVDSTVNA